MCSIAGALLEGKYVSNPEYDRHDDTCSCVSLTKEGKSNSAQIKNMP